MSRKLLGVLVLSVLVLAGATTLAFFSEEVIVESGQVDAVGKVTTIKLTLSEVPGGLSGYNITVRLSNGSVAEIISVDFPGWATLKDNSTLPADAVWLEAVDLTDQIKRNATDVILATLTIRGDEIGNTDIIADINEMDDDDGNPIYPSITNGSINVAPKVVDTTPPITTVVAPELPEEPSPIPSGYELNWTNRTVMLSFQRSDPEPDSTGVAYTNYSTAPEVGSWTTVYGESPFSVNISDEGITTIWYYSVDNAGNKEVTKNTTIRIDKTEPFIVSVALNKYIFNASEQINVTVLVRDDVSGVVNVTADGIPLTPTAGDLWEGTIIAASSPGIYNVTVEAIDHAWNIALNDSVQYVVKEKGDMNGDGEVDFNDVIALAKHIYFGEPIYPQ